jgi:glycosyltransferase involved in cell wall biosynthesis
LQNANADKNLRGMGCLRLALDYRPALLTSVGIGRSVRELSRSLAREPGLDLRLFGHSLARARHAAAVPEGATLHRLPIPGRSMPMLARMGVDAGRLSGGVQLFHWTDYIHPPIRGARTVLTLHDVAFTEDVSFHGKAQTAMLLAGCRKAIAQADLIVTPTAATAAAARRHLAVDANRLRVVPFGCDHVPSLDGGHPLGDHPLGGRPYVLALGTIEPRKNHLRLLYAWQKLAEPRPALVIVGKPGWECGPIVTAIQEAVQTGQVVWHRRASDTQVFRYLAHALLLAYPSRLEGFGFPPLEAAALDTPVLAGDTPALREVLADAAWFCAPEDQDAIDAGLERLLVDERLRHELVERGRQRARQFTWRDSARRHAALYREVVDR